jgi:phosphatidylglycerol:prolipoprotein diacylglycerol transferase
MIVAVISAFSLTIRLAKRSSLERYEVSSALFVTVASGIGGAYITGVIMFLPDLLSAGFGGLSGFSPVLVSWGGILGGTTAVLILWRAWKFSLPDFADLCAPGYLLGIGFGRIGCFFGGCCYGVHTDSWIGVHFTHPLALASCGIQPLVPTQLISAAYLITAGIVFAAAYTRRRFIPGNLFAWSALCYSVFRFSIEFWRDDPRVFLWKFSDGQLFSICFFLTGVIIILRNRKKTGI